MGQVKVEATISPEREHMPTLKNDDEEARLYTLLGGPNHSRIDL